MSRQDRVDGESYRDLGGLPKMLTLSVAAGLTYSMNVNDTVLIVDTTSAGGDGVAIVTLPSLQEAVGRLYFICAPVGSTGGDLSIYEKETGAELTGAGSDDGDLDADDDHVMLFSDGTAWRTILDKVA